MQILYKELNKKLKNMLQTELAEKFHISATYLNDILAKRRSIEPLAKKLGYKKVYIKIR